MELVTPKDRRFSSFYVFDTLEQELYNKIKNGEVIPRGTSNREVMNALTRLRRNRYIKNTGSRTKPEWVILNEPPTTVH